MDFNEIYTLLVVIEKATQHGNALRNIMSAAAARLTEINNEAAPKEGEAA